MPIPLSAHQLVALPRASLAALRAALVRDAGPAAAGYLQEAGYAGGEALFASFATWLGERETVPPEALDVARFQARASEYFGEAGWGSLTIGTLRDAVVTLDSADWAEADPSGAMGRPACHMTTGLFASFFNRIAAEPLAVLEVECRSAGDARCRFLLGNGDVMEHVYGSIERGAGMEAALDGVE